MLTVINVKLDKRMKTALQRLADRQFSTMSSLIKQAIERTLQENNIDWRSEESEQD